MYISPENRDGTDPLITAASPAAAAMSGSRAESIGYGTQRLARRRSYSISTTFPSGRNQRTSACSTRAGAEVGPYTRTWRDGFGQEHSSLAGVHAARYPLEVLWA